ncbi:MAG: hypothetical protein HQ521_03110 [Bacteroidetes bacterium]|nr:hypothetical protein [Bacteroidota bacterium]
MKKNLFFILAFVVACSTAFAQQSSPDLSNSGAGSGRVGNNITTTPVTGITQTSAVSGGSGIYLSGGTIIQKGVCWSSTNSNPLPFAPDFFTEEGNGTANFASTMTGLAPSTTYWVSAYYKYTLSGNTSQILGSVLSFTTLPSCSNAITVTTNADAGAGSLRQALADVCDGGTISFNLSSPNETITISSELSITQGVTIDGANTTGSGTPVTVQVTTPGTSTWRVFNINASGKTVNISNMTIKGGDISTEGDVPAGYGGGIYVAAGILDLIDASVSGSKAYYGGAIYNNGGLTVTSCTIDNNTGVGGGGGIYNYGTLTVTSSTINNNTAVSSSNGGGLVLVASSTTTINSSTINGNNANNGGGLANFEGEVFISNSTISGNTATANSDGIFTLVGTISINNSIIADNNNADFYSLGTTITDNGYNVVGISSGYSWTGTGDWTDQAGSGTFTKYGTSTTGTLNLLPTLANNGGSTQTLALTAGSFAAASPTTGIPSFDNWNNSPVTEGAYTDQRGVVRTADQNTSIGAYSENYSSTYYMAKVTGNWSAFGTVWFTNTTGGTTPGDYTTAATETPTALNSGGIIINADVAVDSDVSIDQTIINASKTLTVNSGVTLTVADGDGTDLTADGGLDINGTLSIGTATIDANGSFDATGGAVTFTDAGYLNLGATVTSLGTLTESTSTIAYDGADQTILSDSYNALTLSGSGTKTFHGTTIAAGGITVAGVTIGETLTAQGDGASSTFIQAAASTGTATSRVCKINTGNTAIFSDVTIRYGKSISGIKHGGGIRNEGTLTLRRVIVSNNEVSGTGFNQGGGIYNYTAGILTVNNSTINNNNVISTGGYFAVGYGGGIYSLGNLTLNNSTIFGNSATASGGTGDTQSKYGGLYIEGIDEINNSTISGNSAGTGVAGMQSGGTLTIRNSIIAENIDSDTKMDYQYWSGTTTDNGYNVVGKSSAGYTWTGTGDWTNQDGDATYTLQDGTGTTTGYLNLSSTLADNGGPTETIALGTDSFAAASDTTGIPPTSNWNGSPLIDGAYTDQRGVVRTAGNNTSIGAYSANYVPPCTDPTSGGTIAADQGSCTGFDPEEITSTAAASGETGTLEYKWQLSTTNSSSGFGDIVSVTSTTYDPPAITTSSWYKRLARVDCSSDWTGAAESNVVAMIVYATFTPGAILTTGETICYNGDPVEIGSSTVASGGDETITYKWESSLDAFATAGSEISGATSENYDPPANLMATTSYRRYAHDGTCNTTFGVSTGTWLVTVRDDFTPGAIETTGETICYNGDPGVIGNTTSASGGDDSFTYQWQYSTDNFSTVTNTISSSDAETYDPPSGITTTTYYRRQAKDGTCNTTFESSTGVWMVTVRDEFVAGEIETTGETICYNGDPGVIGSTTSASGGDGSITYQWQYSIDNFSTVTNTISSSDAATYDPPSGLTSSTYYRRQAKDATCNTVFESSIGTWLVTVYDEFTPGAILTTGEGICYDGDPNVIGSSTLASGGDGTITYSWESSIDDFATAGSVISGATSTSYDPPANLTTTTSYRRYAHDATCNTTFETSTGTWKVTVYDELAVGSISEDQAFCTSGTPDEFVGVAPSGGNTPYTYQWQSSADGITFGDISGATDLNYQPGELTDTTYYRLQQSSASSCGMLITDTVTIIIHSLCCGPEVNFCQSPDPNAQNNNALVSDVLSGLKIYDNFSNIIGGITDIEWWGSTVVGEDYCDENQKNFVISFYRDNAGTVGELYRTYPVNATGTNTGSTYGTNSKPILRYSYTLSEPFSGLVDGWVSIQGSPAGSCDFAWLTSPYGDGKSFVDGRSQLTDDFAFGLTADPSIPVSDWAIYIGIILIGGFIVFGFRKRFVV